MRAFLSYLFLIFYLCCVSLFLAAFLYILHDYLVELDPQTFYYDLLEYDHKQVKLLAAYNFCIYMLIYSLLHYWSVFWLNLWWLFFNFLEYCSNVFLYFSWFLKCLMSSYRLSLSWFFSAVQFFLKVVRPLFCFKLLSFLVKYNLMFESIWFFFIFKKYVCDIFWAIRMEIWLIFFVESFVKVNFHIFVNYDLHVLNFFGF